MTDETHDTKVDAPDDAPAAPPPDVSDDPSDPVSDPERLQGERDELRDLLLRKTAEFDNYRKRTERERAELGQAAAADLLSDLLPLVDNLDRALAADVEHATAESFRAGVELIRRQLLDLLEQRGVTAIEARGADFDPHLHEAVATESSETHRDGEVIEELQRGYTLGGRLLRAAMVRVAKS